MRKLFTQIIICCMLVGPFGVQAQQIIGGIVTDESGEPLPGVNVIIENTATGVSTDFDGNYQIQAEDGQVLVFSFIGFDSQKITVSGSDTLNVILNAGGSELDEVVLIGYGSSLKKDLTGALDVVSSEDFVKGSISSPQQLIQGKVAGVSVVSNSGAPGAGSNILVRGIGSLNLNSSPLFVVDGIPLDGSGVGGSRNLLNVINPDDIEGITVLKDASATSIYGSRAANGVILITTKSAKAGDLKLNFKTTTSFFEPVSFVDVLNADEFRTFVGNVGDSDDVALLGDANTDWQKEIYNNAYAINSSLSASGNILGAPVRASVGYTDQDGILKDDNFNRITANLRVTPSFLDGDLKVDINTRYQKTDNTFASRGAIGSSLYFDPTYPVYDESSPFLNYFTFLNADGTRQANLATTNPMAILDLIDDTSEVNRIISSVKADYNIPFVDGLTATVNGAIDQAKGEGQNIQSSDFPTSEEGYDGRESNYSNETTNKLLDAYLNYRFEPTDDVNISATAGYSYQSFEYDNQNSNYSQYLDENGEINTTTSILYEFIDKSKNVLLSYFGRANVNIGDKYLLTGTIRADASSKLNPDNRWGYFPSVAFAWNLHNEKFLSDSNILDQLKIRIGYGEVGNVNGLGDYNFLTRYESGNAAAQYVFGGTSYQTYRPQPINKDLRWEIGKTLNAGIDFVLFDNRLSGSVNVYKKETNDLIAASTTDPFTNFGTTIDANIGDMENKGIEVVLNTTPIKKDDFELNLGYNIAINDNEITRLNNEQKVGTFGFGTSIQRHRVGRAPYSFYVYKQIYDEAGKPIEGAYADLNGDGTINNDDLYFYKDPYADILMGLTLSMRYKKFDFSAVSRASLGNYVYNNNAAGATTLFPVSRLTYNINVNAAILDHGFNQQTPENQLSDHFVRNASFFRLDNVTLGYSVPNLFNSMSARFFVTANNLLVITDYDGIDPEITGGLDDSFYPRSRVFALGVDFNF